MLLCLVCPKYDETLSSLQYSAISGICLNTIEPTSIKRIPSVTEQQCTEPLCVHGGNVDSLTSLKQQETKEASKLEELPKTSTSMSLFGSKLVV